MPSLIPSLNSCVVRMTSGEKRFAVRLEQKLDDDYLIWYDVPIGKKLHPDFIVLHPLRGLLALEVKDWKIDTIKNVTRANWTIADRHTNAPKQVKNPLEQARNYILHAAKLLERDADLVHAIADEARLLYVAMTRATYYLEFHTNQRSPHLKIATHQELLKIFVNL